MQVEVSGVIWNNTNADQDSYAPSPIPDTLQCLEWSTGTGESLALWNGTVALGLLFFLFFFSHMQTQCLFRSCHCPFPWEDGQIAGTTHTRKSHLLRYDKHAALSVAYFRQTIHSVWSCYLGTIAWPLLYFYSSSYHFIPSHSCTYSLLKLFTTISAYKKVSITTVMLSLPSCK